MAITPSISRISTLSTDRAYPVAMPNATPNATLRSATVEPTTSETRPPYSTRL